ncbi:MAG: hypothetical protein ACREFN_07590, partial [Acetobacteraceae bacterium]
PPSVCWKSQQAQRFSADLKEKGSRRCGVAYNHALVRFSADLKEKGSRRDGFSLVADDGGSAQT